MSRVPKLPWAIVVVTEQEQPHCWDDQAKAAQLDRLAAAPEKKQAMTLNIQRYVLSVSATLP